MFSDAYALHWISDLYRPTPPDSQILRKSRLEVKLSRFNRNMYWSNNANIAKNFSHAFVFFSKNYLSAQCSFFVDLVNLFLLDILWFWFSNAEQQHLRKVSHILKEFPKDSTNFTASPNIKILSRPTQMDPKHLWTILPKNPAQITVKSSNQSYFCLLDFLSDITNSKQNRQALCNGSYMIAIFFSNARRNFSGRSMSSMGGPIRLVAALGVLGGAPRKPEKFLKSSMKIKNLEFLVKICNFFIILMNMFLFFPNNFGYLLEFFREDLVKSYLWEPPKLVKLSKTWSKNRWKPLINYESLDFQKPI